MDEGASDDASRRIVDARRSQDREFIINSEERAAIDRLVAHERAITDRDALVERTSERRRNLLNTILIASTAAIVSSMLTLSTVPLWLRALIDVARWAFHIRVVLVP